MPIELTPRFRFHGYDQDGSGYFDLTEFKNVYRALGRLQTSRIFAFYDKNNDCKVTWEEYEQRSDKQEILVIMKIQYLLRQIGSDTLFLSGTKSCDTD